jgi:hypothetical protein
MTEMHYPRFVLTVVAALVATLMPISCWAGIKEGRVASVLVLTSIPDRAFIKIDGSYTQAEPGCSGGAAEFDFIFDISTATGKALYALALSAHATGTSVVVGGRGTCLFRSGYEDLDYIQTAQ